MNTFSCTSCGAKSPSWIGKCSVCDGWNTYQEEPDEIPLKTNKYLNRDVIEPLPLDNLSSKKQNRIISGISELDRVLGGGIIKGSAVLIAGEPGIGKSTLILQLAGILSNTGKVLYISGEESFGQIKVRADRLKIKSNNLYIFPETRLFEIEKNIEKLSPDFIIIDSIQTIEKEDISSGAGSISQVKESGIYLIHIAKNKNIPLFIIGQITKEGSIAGPKILEHMVDTVLYFEGDQNSHFRILRTTKNRFGSTNEVGIFEMAEEGLKEISDPSKILLEKESLGSPGSVVTCTLTGTRPLMVEVQALTSPSKLASPRRIVTGLNYNRCSIIIGVLERKAGIRLSESDVYLNVASGIYVDEPACDLAVLTAIASSSKNKGIDPNTVIIGEIGLTGEIRGISNTVQRVSEAKKLGFKKAIIPNISDDQIKKVKSNGIEIIPVKNIKEVLNKLSL